MVIRRAYKRVKVNSVERTDLAAMVKAQKSAILGLDIAKGEIVACLRWQSGEFERPWSATNPSEIKALVDLCSFLVSVGLDLKIAMESTGTYGDAARFAMTAAKLPVLRVSGKNVSDYKEIFDGVPSQHDGKDAAMIAELCALGKATHWPFVATSEFLAEVSLLVRRMDSFTSDFVQWQGRLEGVLARSWPELGSLLKSRNITTMNMLLEYGSPTAVGKCKKVASKLLAWGRGKLSEARIECIVQSAKSTAGIPMNNQEIIWIKEICQRSLIAKRGVALCEKQLKKLIAKEKFWSNYVDTVGAGTLGAILSTVGDPREYPSAGALLKACGLNLKERSSGKRIGEKAITKRGPAMLRRWLFFWAMRSVQRDELREWFFRFHSSHYGNRDRPMPHRKMKGLVCMMRKLMRSLWSSMNQGTDFEYGKVVQSLAKPKRRRSRKSKT